MKNDPREIQARFPCLCSETGERIAKGDACLYYPSDKSVVSLKSESAKQWFSLLFDEQILSSN